MIDRSKYIERDPLVAAGKPVFKGTRITVEFILERLAQGATAEDLVENYPGLQRTHIPAALTYAARSIWRGTGDGNDTDSYSRRPGVCGLRVAS